LLDAALTPGLAHRLPVEGAEKASGEEQKRLVEGSWDGKGADQDEAS